MRVFIQVYHYRLWHIVLNNIDKIDSNYIYLNVTAIKILYSALDSHMLNRISSCILAHTIWNKLKNIYEYNLHEHVHVDINEFNDISPKILVVKNIVNTNQESNKIELSISKNDSHQKLTNARKMKLSSMRYGKFKRKRM